MSNIKKSTDNKTVKCYLNSQEEFSNIYNYESYGLFIDSNINDRLYGASGQLSGSIRTTPYRIFSMLRVIDIIDVKTISTILNRRKIALTGKPYSTSYIYQWISMLTCASQSIYHYLLTRTN
ncbi:hypothetical protein [Photobacterium phosphoreum]|jgi:hypothetical protein|uniref:hypothetical protein n=1 Tax=Photobacterium phosphoreum TaxID=659 RepID=UPI000D182615|nr:hypothetical protein [Photobacterium phosphoreum]PSU38483.1 hypothetical protein CTM85_09145 [Photobacterium phosphoreum]